MSGAQSPDAATSNQCALHQLEVDVPEAHTGSNTASTEVQM